MELRPNLVKQKFNIDWTLVIILGLLFITSITSIYLSTPLANVPRLVEKQLMWYTTGFMIVGVLIYFGIENVYGLMKYLYIFLMITLIFLVLDDKLLNVPFVSEINGARSWYNFPGIGSFQPSEFMKIVLILMTATIVSDHNKEKLEVSYTSDIMLFIKVLKVAVPPLVLIVLQPDTGIPLIIVVSIIAILCVSGIKKLWIYVGFLTVVGGLALFVYVFLTNQQLLIDIFGDSYRFRRFYGWLEPEKYVRTWGGQLYEGLLAIGSAGFSGHPLNQAIVFFAEPQNDFIFAVIGQNFGFLGTTFIVILSAALDLKLLSIAFQTDNERDKLMIIGLVGMIFFQQVENMGMITGLLPITGITLPFISYGGSSLWSYMIPLAIVFKTSSDIIRKNGPRYR